MAESLFDIFGDHLTRQGVKNVTRQPFSNNENIGKTVSTGPIKLNEPMKKIGEPMKKIGEPKKSFLSNTGKALQGSTPIRNVFTPRAKNVGPQIYMDENDKGFNIEEIEFTKAPVRKDYHCELFDYFPKMSEHKSPASTPPPEVRRYSFELDCSYQDEFYTDNFSNDSLPDEDDDDLGLPNLY